MGQKFFHFLSLVVITLVSVVYVLFSFLVSMRVMSGGHIRLNDGADVSVVQWQLSCRPVLACWCYIVYLVCGGTVRQLRRCYERSVLGHMWSRAVLDGWVNR